MTGKLDLTGYAAARILVFFAISAAAGTQTLVRLNTLVANQATVSAGDVTFSDFAKPGYIATPSAVETAVRRHDIPAIHCDRCGRRAGSDLAGKRSARSAFA